MSAKEFREELLKCENNNDIANLVLQHATKPTDFAPVTVPVPGIPGAKLTYDVMRGYISADDYPVPVDANTADALAKRWGLHLPTAKMVDQITEESARTGGIVKVNPLSATGYSSEDLKLSPEEIVSRHISNPRLIDRHNELVREYVREKGISPDSIIVGDQKILIAPEPGKEGRTHFKGFLRDIKTGPDGKPHFQFYQSGLGASPHSARGHFEYPLKSKLVSNNMTISLPNGEKKSLTFAEAMQIPEIAAAISNSPISTYSKSEDQKYKYTAKGDKKKKIEDLPTKTESSTENKPSKNEGQLAVTDKPKDLWSDIKETATEAWDKTKNFLGSVFSQAEEFELTATSEEKKTQLLKIALKRELRDSNFRKGKVSYEPRKNKRVGK